MNELKEIKLMLNYQGIDCVDDIELATEAILNKVIEYAESGINISIAEAWYIISNDIELKKEVYIHSKYNIGNSTRSHSLADTDLGKTTNEVYNYLSSNPRSSRNEIQRALNMRLSTVCGAVRPLIKKGFVKVVGKTYDNETRRHVETLIAVK